MIRLPRQAKLNFLENVLYWCTIWENVGTYLTSPDNSKEKTELIVAINHFKEKEKSKVDIIEP